VHLVDFMRALENLMIFLHLHMLASEHFKLNLEISILLDGVLYPGYRGSLVTAQKFGFDWFSTAANGSETIHPVLDMTPPLLAEEEGPPS
jgi:hypothetical protein